MLSMFRTVRELYILATGKQLDSDSLIESECIKPEIESIDLRGVLRTTSAGVIAYAKFNRTQLRMNPPDNEKTPYQQIKNTYYQMEGGNGPIVMFTRQPGMIVGYDYEGSWTHRMPRSEPDTFIICLFVANSKNRLKNIKDAVTNINVSLEEYIRQGEKADHASWTDRTIYGKNPKIISNIQKNIINKIKKKYNEASPIPVQKENIGLAHALANLLLPAEDFGNKSSSGGSARRRGGSSSKSSKGGIAVIGEVSYQQNKTIMPFELRLTSEHCLVSLRVNTEFKNYEADVWEDEEEIGMEFPMTIDSITVSSLSTVSKNKSVYEQFIHIDADCMKNENEYICFEIKKSARLKTMSYFTVDSKIGSCIIRGELRLKFSDTTIKGSLGYKEMK